MAKFVEIGAARTSIARQARKWLVRMDGDEPLSDAEKQALKELMSRSVLHRKELIRIARFYNQANILTELYAGLESKRRQRGERRSRKRRWTILMTAICASMILAYCSLGQLSATSTHAYTTIIGQQRTILLSDGSYIQLNTDSHVEVSYTDKARKIRLVRGEGHFTVTPDPSRVFEVYAADSIVRAVGTAFAVRLEGHRVDVTVEKGVVVLLDARRAGSTVARTLTKAAPPAANLGQLSGGEVTSFVSGSGHMEVRRIDDFELRLRMAWEEGSLAFDGEPLSQVVTQLNRYSTRKLVIGDPRLASLTVGGRFKIGDMDSVLRLLRTTFKIRARQGSDGTITLEPERE